MIERIWPPSTSELRAGPPFDAIRSAGLFYESSASDGALEATAAAFREVDFDTGIAAARRIYDQRYLVPSAKLAREALLAKRKQQRRDSVR